MAVVQEGYGLDPVDELYSIDPTPQAQAPTRKATATIWMPSETSCPLSEAQLRATEEINPVHRALRQASAAVGKAFPAPA